MGGSLQAGDQVTIFRVDGVREQPVQQLEGGLQVQGRLFPREATIISATGQVQLHSLPHQHLSQELHTSALGPSGQETSPDRGTKYHSCSARCFV